MGQYHKVYNVDKKQFIHAHNIGLGLKLLEQVGFEKSTADALFLMVANSNGQGGGDAPEHPLIGSWAGDRIVVQGDYADEKSRAFIPDTEEYEDISTGVNEMLDKVFPRSE
ncbi:MAG: hypothetical protein KBC53_00015 [Nitrosomonas sp.]|nr:hypothetical protein [Nitrosomonas sp.]MBX9636722.1 hypothetical protein [Nitrosomonas sp.]